MSRKKILLVDDVHLILELEKVFLRGLPVEIITASNGVEALEIVKNERPDLIYIDLNMPVMDGPTCCRILKADPLTRNIPVIMVTTAGRPQDELLCRTSGCDDYITKPINSKLFLEKGRNCIADFERRKKRYNYATEVQFLEKGEPRHGLMTDISLGGLYIATPDKSTPDDPVDLAFRLPLNGGNILVAARGRVAWDNSPSSPKKPNYPPGVGVEFVNIDPAAIAAIEAFFEQGIATSPNKE